MKYLQGIYCISSLTSGKRCTRSWSSTSLHSTSSPWSHGKQRWNFSRVIPFIVALLISVNACSSPAPAPKKEEHIDLPPGKNPISPTRMEYLRSHNLYDFRLQEKQIPGYERIGYLSHRKYIRQNNHLVPQPIKKMPGDFSQPIELRETDPEQCIASLASPVYNTSRPTEHPGIKDTYIVYFASEFYSIHQEIILYPNAEQSYKAFDHTQSVLKDCKTFELTSADVAKSTATLSVKTPPHLGIKSMFYTVYDKRIYNQSFSQIAYVYMGDVLLRITAESPAHNAHRVKFIHVLREAVHNITG